MRKETRCDYAYLSYCYNTNIANDTSLSLNLELCYVSRRIFLISM